MVEIHHVAYDGLDRGTIERFKVAEEIARLRHIPFRLLVQPTMDRIVGTLEQAILAIRHELVADAPDPMLAVQETPWHHDRSGDVVLELNLLGGRKILSQLVRLPAAVAVQTNAEVHPDQFAILVLEFMSRLAIDDINAKVSSPIALPFRLAKTLDDKRHGVDVTWNCLQPGVVLIGIIAGGRQAA